MQILAFRHVPFEDLGLIETALQKNGIGWKYVDLYENPQADAAISDAAGLIFMGGPMSVNDDLPWLRREEQLIRDAMARGLPVLGVCLGSQLIARALDTRVYFNPVKEIGWAPVYWTEAAARDRLFEGLDAPETVFHWHSETFDLPDGAQLLASSDACRNQAYRLGTNVYGLQFHLEVTPEIIADWCRQDANCGDVRELDRPIDPHAGATRLAELAGLVFGRWCALVK